MRSLALCITLAGCAATPGPDPREAALGAWPTDPEALVSFCPTLPVEEVVTICHVQAAAGFGRAGRSDPAWEVCAQVPQAVWKEECHFRAGEELGKAGETLEALRHCAAAGWFGRFCLTHAGWNLPQSKDLGPTTAPAQVERAGLELLGAVDQALAGAGDGLEGEGRDIVMARYGFNLYVGSGRADPRAAHLDGPLGAAVRGGFGVEAARLLDAPTMDGILAIWNGEAPIPTGDVLHARDRVGRYTVPIDSPFERGLPHLPTFGGSRRMVGETADEDMAIAALEGMFWVDGVPAEAFVSALDDPRPRVRWTAARMVRLAPAESLDQPALLTRLAAEHPDENVRWHAQDGLDTRSFERMADPITRDYPGGQSPPPNPPRAAPKASP